MVTITYGAESFLQCKPKKNKVRQLTTASQSSRYVQHATSQYSVRCAEEYLFVKLYSIFSARIIRSHQLENVKGLYLNQKVEINVDFGVRR